MSYILSRFTLRNAKEILPVKCEPTQDKFSLIHSHYSVATMVHIFKFCPENIINPLDFADVSQVVRFHYTSEIGI